jgi:uncharacterized membrane protein
MAAWCARIFGREENMWRRNLKKIVPAVLWAVSVLLLLVDTYNSDQTVINLLGISSVSIMFGLVCVLIVLRFKIEWLTSKIMRCLVGGVGVVAGLTSTVLILWDSFTPPQRCL